MRRIAKLRDSEILIRNLSYKRQNDKIPIREILMKEQKSLCAYTEAQMGYATYSKDIEHFNPTIKNTNDDGYENWYLVSTVWNKKKGTKNANSRWSEYKSELSPSSPDIECRLKYDIESGAIIQANVEDKDASSIIKYLLLDHPDLSRDRLAYLKMLKGLYEDYNSDIEKLKSHLRKNPLQISYASAVKAVFGFDPTSL